MTPAKTDAIIFDLDGTLWDTCASCAEAWNRVLQRNNISFRAVTDQDVRKVTGLSHRECIEKTFSSLSQNEIETIVRETEFEDNMAIKELGGVLYDGVIEGIEEMKDFYPLYIVSNCQAGYIEQFLEFSQLGSFFKDFECWGNTQLPKNKNIDLLRQRNSLKNPVYIGDTLGDKVAAGRAKIPFYFVEYGFGEVEHANTFSSFLSLTHHFLKNAKA